MNAKLLTFDFVMTFGKYKGKTIKEIYNWGDSSYLSWALRTITWFRMSEEDTHKIIITALEERRQWLLENYDVGDCYEHYGDNE